MQLETIGGNKESNIYVSFHTDYDVKTVKTAGKLLDTLINPISFNKKIGYAGFSTKRALRSELKFLIFGKNFPKGKKKFLPFPFKKTDILPELIITLKKCQGKLPAKSIWIFVFPTFDPFVKNKMSGVGGFTPSKHTILLTLHPEAKRWKRALHMTSAHEFNHSIRLRYFPFHLQKTLLDAIIFEGLADNFSHRLFGGKPNPWVTAISLKKCKKIFPKIKKLLSSTNRKVYYSLFFGGKRYPLWTGYALGYQIVKNFLQNNPKLGWKEIMKLKSEEILEKSGF